MEKEIQTQAQIYQYYNNNYCLSTMKPRSLIFSVPNGGYRNPIEAQQMKASGTLPGVSDLIIVHAVEGKEPIIAFVEVKTEKGKLSPVQEQFKQRVADLGLIYSVVRSLDEFKLLISTL